MKLGEFKTKTAVRMVQGEEPLYAPYSFKTVRKTERMIASVDSGSTQPRVAFATADDQNIEEQWIIPALYGVVIDDREILPKSEDLYDHLDSYIMNNELKNDKVFDKLRVVRGRKLVDSNATSNRIDSSTQKIDNPAFYVNIIDGIAYGLARKYGEEIPDHVEILASVALPPDDMSSTTNKERFKNNLIGTYTWKHVESGATIKIDIKDVVLATEPEASIYYYFLSKDEEVPEVVLAINTGGRSIGLELLINGKTGDMSSTTLPFGGTQFMKDLGKAYVTANGGRVPSDKLLSEAVITGKLKDGNSHIDVTDIIRDLCKDYANKIMSGVISEIFDMQTDYTIKSLNAVVVSGGMMRSGEYDISIADYLEILFKEKTPNTDYFIELENLIPAGLAVIAYQEDAGFIMPDDEDLEEVSADGADEE